MTLTPEDLAKIEARVNAATEGPWFNTSGSVWIHCQDSIQQWQEKIADSSEDNALFISHARQDIPALIAALKEARAENERVKESNIIKNTVIPSAETNLEVRVGEDGVWLEFKASTGKEAVIHVFSVLGEGNSLREKAITDWVLDMQKKRTTAPVGEKL